jgi:hypothetical protein
MGSLIEMRLNVHQRGAGGLACGPPLSWLVYALVDCAVVAASALTLRIGALLAVSLLTKLSSAYLGASAAGWRA